MTQIFTMDVEQNIDAALAFAFLLKKHGLRGEFYICGFLVEKYPIKCKKIAQFHTVGGHGYYHENFAKISYSKQRRIIQKTAAVFAQHGMKMEGWRFPRLDFTNKSLHCLAKMGIYDSSFNREVWQKWGKIIFFRNWLSNLKRKQFFFPHQLPPHFLEKPWDHVDLEDNEFYTKKGRLIMHCYAFPAYRVRLENFLARACQTPRI